MILNFPRVSDHSVKIWNEFYENNIVGIRTKLGKEPNQSEIFESLLEKYDYLKNENILQEERIKELTRKINDTKIDNDTKKALKITTGITKICLPTENQTVYFKKGETMLITLVGRITIEKPHKDHETGLELIANVKFSLTNEGLEKLYYLPIYKDDPFIISIYNQLLSIKRFMPQIIELFTSGSADLTGATFSVHCIEKNVRYATYIEPKDVPYIKAKNCILNDKLLELRNKQKSLENNLPKDNQKFIEGDASNKTEIINIFGKTLQREKPIYVYDKLPLTEDQKIITVNAYEERPKADHKERPKADHEKQSKCSNPDCGKLMPANYFRCPHCQTPNIEGISADDDSFRTASK